MVQKDLSSPCCYCASAKTREDCIGCYNKRNFTPMPTAAFKYRAELCRYDQLPSGVNTDGLPNNGAGRECAMYIVQYLDEKIISVESDAIEPEDARFGRDLSWVVDALNRAYRFGLEVE